MQRTGCLPLLPPPADCELPTPGPRKSSRCPRHSRPWLHTRSCLHGCCRLPVLVLASSGVWCSLSNQRVRTWWRGVGGGCCALQATPRPTHRRSLLLDFGGSCLGGSQALWKYRWMLSRELPARHLTWALFSQSRDGPTAGMDPQPLSHPTSRLTWDVWALSGCSGNSSFLWGECGRPGGPGIKSVLILCLILDPSPQALARRGRCEPLVSCLTSPCEHEGSAQKWAPTRPLGGGRRPGLCCCLCLLCPLGGLESRVRSRGTSGP